MGLRNGQQEFRRGQDVDGCFLLKCLVFHVMNVQSFPHVYNVQRIAASPRRMPFWILAKHSETSVAQKSLSSTVTMFGKRTTTSSAPIMESKSAFESCALLAQAIIPQSSRRLKMATAFVWSAIFSKNRIVVSYRRSR